MYYYYYYYNYYYCCYYYYYYYYYFDYLLHDLEDYNGRAVMHALGHAP